MSSFKDEKSTHEAFEEVSNGTHAPKTRLKLTVLLINLSSVLALGYFYLCTTMVQASIISTPVNAAITILLYAPAACLLMERMRTYPMLVKAFLKLMVVTPCIFVGGYSGYQLACLEMAGSRTG